MEEYLREHRNALGSAFNGAGFGFSSKVIAADTPPENNHSLSSSFSSINSQEVGDFISEFRNAYYGLRLRKGNGLLTKQDVGEVLYLLDQEATEDLLAELFNEIDKEKVGVIEVEVFLEILNKRLNPPNNKASTPKSHSPPASSSAACSLRNSAEFAVAAASTTNANIPKCSREAISSSSPSPPISGHGKRSSNSTPPSKPLVENNKPSLGASGRKQRSQPMILWWGFQDLADTL